MSLADQARRQLRKLAARQKSEVPEHLGVKAEFDQALEAAKRYFSAATQTDRNMVAVMKHISSLHMQTNGNEEASTYLKTLYIRHGIRITRATPNPFTPLLKLIVPDLPKETARRSAAALEYAREQRVAPDRLADFIKSEGGIVRCAQTAREAAKPKSKQRQAEKEEMQRSILREKAKPVVAPVLSDGLDDGLWNCLIEKENGQLRLLSVRIGRINSKSMPLGVNDFLDFN